jgi:Arc/MetJ-type ribon-helix-helix transcriptional regulator
VLGEGHGLKHGLGEIGERRGDFGFYFTAGDCAKEARHGNGEIASGEQFCRKEARNVLADLLGGEGFGFLLGMEVTEIQMAGAARSAALAAIMAIQLTPEQERRIQAVVRRGACESVEEVVEAALAAVEQRTVPGFRGTQEELDICSRKGSRQSNWWREFKTRNLRSEGCGTRLRTPARRLFCQP